MIFILIFTGNESNENARYQVPKKCDWHTGHTKPQLKSRVQYNVLLYLINFSTKQTKKKHSVNSPMDSFNCLSQMFYFMLVFYLHNEMTEIWVADDLKYS